MENNLERNTQIKFLSLLVLSVIGMIKVNVESDITIEWIYRMEVFIVFFVIISIFCIVLSIGYEMTTKKVQNTMRLLIVSFVVIGFVVVWNVTIYLCL